MKRHILTTHGSNTHIRCGTLFSDQVCHDITMGIQFLSVIFSLAPSYIITKVVSLSTVALTMLFHHVFNVKNANINRYVILILI